MNELLDGVNWLAVIVGFVVAFIIGAIWYSPKLFGAKLAEGVGVDINESSGPAIMPLVVQAVGTFLLSWLVGITAAANALFTILLIMLTIIVLMVAGGLFSQKSRYAIVTEASYVLVMVVVMIIVQGIF